MAGLLLFLAILVLLAGALWAAGQLLHSWLYVEVPPDLRWRAPTAAGGICLLAFLCPLVFDAMTGGHWPRTFEDFVLLRNVRRDAATFKEFIAKIPGRGEVRYLRLTTPRGGVEFLDARVGGRSIPETVTEITGTIDGAEARRIVFHKKTNGRVRWIDETGGHVMRDDEFGTLTYFHWPAFWFIVFAGIFLYGVWFTALWVGVRLIPTHAALLAVPAAFTWTLVMSAWG